MCGIAGIVGWQGLPEPEVRATLQRMTDSLAHRGPDDAGAWWDCAAGVGLGFRRLAVIDLGPTGHQPMLSSDGRFVVVFNGEIYNHLELKRELSDGAAFRGTSDTEVVLEAVVRWGAAAAVRRFWGMFAFALFDRRERQLMLARDRFGKKPLYYALDGTRLLFASELKALRAAAPGAEVDRESVRAYFRKGYVPSPRTIYRGTCKLPPGHVAVLRAGGRLDLDQYWDARAVAREGIRTRRQSLTDEQAIGEANDLLRDAVGRRMISDVPLGAFLSGGIDSSTVVALMQAASGRPVRTFTLGYRDADFDEAPAARAVAQHLGTDHTELYVTSEDARQVIPRLPDIYDEPLADCSQIPTVLVSALARTQVTVALSGDGGDELFGGYVRHVWAARVRAHVAHWPAGLRSVVAAGLGCVSPAAADRCYRLIEKGLPATARQVHPGEKLAKLAQTIGAGTDDEAYALLTAVWPDRVVTGEPARADEPTRQADAPRLEDFAERMMLRDQQEYLPDNILAKVDRASMAASLESRAPLLDHRLAEWVWQVPPRFRCRDGRGKWLLRQVLARHVPPAIFERPKAGFGIPVGDWMRGPLRAWCASLLEPGRLAREGFLDSALVGRVWQEHLAGKRDHYARLWAVLMFESWLDRWG